MMLVDYLSSCRAMAGEIVQEIMKKKKKIYTSQLIGNQTATDTNIEYFTNIATCLAV